MAEKPYGPVELTKEPNIADALNDKNKAGSATSFADKLEYLEPPVKSDCDDWVYRALKLPNGLTVLLVSQTKDGKRSKSGIGGASRGNEKYAAGPSKTLSDYTMFPAPGMVDCSLTIDVGCFSNPAEYPCIAELLSRVFLTASKKYPIHYSFEKFLRMQNCTMSAYCSNERTLFSFTTQEIHLREGLQRFINFFVEPLLKPEVVELQKSVESHSILVKDAMIQSSEDPACTRAKEYLFGTLASKCADNPARHLVPGRYKYLRSMSTYTLLEEIEKFMKRHYSAHRMMASLNAELSLDELEEYAKTYFSQIPSNGLPPVDFGRFTSDKCFDIPEFRMIYEIQASQKVLDHQLELHWTMPSPTALYKSKPTTYISWIFEQTAKGSLIWYLRKKNWCIDLRCSTGNTSLEPNSIFSLLRLNLTVTEEGHNNYKKILDAVYSYINLMRSEGPQRKCYEEIREQLDSEFRRDDKFLRCVHYSPVNLTLHDYPSADYLNGSIVLSEYDPAAIKQCLELMSSEKANIIVCQKKFGTRHALGEKWEKIHDRVEDLEYRKSTIPEAWLNRWRNVEPVPEFKLPKVDDKTILKPADSHKYPVKIHSDDLCEVYLLDTEFRHHTSFVSLSYCTPSARESAEVAFMIDAFAYLLNSAIVEMLRPASFESQVQPSDTGLMVQVKGSERNLLPPMESIAKIAATLAKHVTKNLFSECKTVLLVRYSRRFCSPGELANEVMLGIERSGRWSSLQKYDASSGVNLEKFKRFVKHFVDHIFVKCLAQGDFVGSEVIATVRNCVRVLKCRPALPHSLPQRMIHVFPPGTRCCRFQSISCDNVTAVMNHYQFDERSVRQTAVINLLLTTIVAPTLKALRARQNLDDYEMRPASSIVGSYGYSLATVKSQGKTITSVATIEATIEAFREALNIWFRDLTTMEWEQVKTAYKTIMGPTKSIGQQVIDNNWREVQSGAYVFNRAARDLKVLNELSIEDLRRCMMHLTSNDSSIRKLCVQAISRREYAEGSAGARQTQSRYRLNFLTNLPGEEVKPDDYYIKDIAAYTRGLTTYPFTS